MSRHHGTRPETTTTMKTKLSLTLMLVALGAASAACAPKTPSHELQNARAAYQQAANGPAAQLELDRLLSAKQALDKAEKAHSEDAQSSDEKHLAYMAERVANLADTYAKVAMNQRAAVGAKAEKDQLSESRRVKAEGQVVKTQQELDAERAARITAEAARKRAEAQLQSALRSLADLAKVKEEPRGLVITLNGSVLFATNKSALLPAAQTKLDEVAKALMDLGNGQTIVVEGHTDSEGADEPNMTLSRARAQAVRDHLVSRGVPQDRISSVGKGEGTPIADNTSAEGRANNRRVEIVISPPTGPTASR